MTGRQLAALRLALGVTQNALAARMGTYPSTLTRWEASAETLAPETVARWQNALRICALARRRELARIGLKLADLPTQSLATLLARYAV